MSKADKLRAKDYLSHILEAIERYHPDFADEHSDMPWGIAYEMRNALSHGYFMVDTEIVWKSIQNDLPGLADQIRELMTRA